MDGYPLVLISIPGGVATRGAGYSLTPNVLVARAGEFSARSYHLPGNHTLGVLGVQLAMSVARVHGWMVIYIPARSLLSRGICRFRMMSHLKV